MDHDDAPIGRLYSRREAVALFGAAGASLFATGAAAHTRAGGAPRLLWPPTCIARPEQTEGPYFVDEDLKRSDIRSNRADGAVSAGVPLDLGIHVSRVANDACEPLAGALVDVWQCDALGVYSGVKDTAGRFDTVGQNFLRGQQISDDTGTARFTTIYPGWYEGRTIHIHFKIRTAAAGGNTYDFTSQVYFEDDLSTRVIQREPYSRKTGTRVLNERDGIFRQGGDQLMLTVSPQGDGYTSDFAIGLRLD